MRFDTIISFFIAVGLITLFAFSDKLVPSKKKTAAVVDDTPVMEVQILPQVEIEPPDVSESSDERASTDTSTFVPPMAAESFSPDIQQTDFKQQAQHVPKPDFNTDASQINIPTNVNVGIGQKVQEIFTMDQLDERPTPRFQPLADYPYEAKKEGLEGFVDLEFIIKANGKVENIKVTKSSDHRFEDSAIKCVERWTFRAGRKSGVAVPVRAAIRIPYTLDN